MQLSCRVKNIQPSLTLSINAKVKNLKKAGIDVINFSVGEPNFHTPTHICKAAKQAIDNGFHGYTPSDGILELKKAVIDKFRYDNGLTYTTDQVIINVGGKHSSYLLMQALLNNGDEVIIPAPYWVSYPPMVTLAGGKPVIISTNEINNFKIYIDDLVKVITLRTKAIFINSPNNPTGTIYNAEELKSIAELCVKKNIYIISDEIYESIIFDNHKFISTAALGKEVFDFTITLNGVSKAYAMTGWRIGYMAGPEFIIKACAKIQSQSTSNPSSISQKAAIAALNGIQDNVKLIQAEFEKRRNYIIKRLQAIPGCSCLIPKGTFYVFPNLSAYFGKKFNDKIIKNSVELSNYLLEYFYIATVPGAAFGNDNYLRFSFAISLKQIKNGIDRLEDGLNKLS